VKTFQLKIKSESELAHAAQQLLAHFPEKKIFAFHGDLGAGKTTFIKVICEQLGVKDAMSSPSFSLVNEYRDEKNNSVYHFDLYRLKSPQEAFDIGMEEYLYSGNYCFVEWPERAEEILPETTLHITIQEINGHREITAGSNSKI
jgi:tRNA threonylcarbamoyladenosine biosynthesis protein TsaE